jgi:glutathione reductase (NADPH)
MTGEPSKNRKEGGAAQALPLGGFDEEARRFLAEQYIERGVNVHAGGTPKKIVKQADGKLSLTVALPGKGDVVLEDVDHVLFATGRKPNSHNLGLEEVLSPSVPLEAPSLFLVVFI